MIMHDFLIFTYFSFEKKNNDKNFNLVTCGENFDLIPVLSLIPC